MPTYFEVLKIYNEAVHSPYRYARPLKGSPEADLLKQMMDGKKVNLKKVKPDQVYTPQKLKIEEIRKLIADRKVTKVLEAGEKLGFKTSDKKEASESEVQDLFSKARAMGFNI